MNIQSRLSIRKKITLIKITILTLIIIKTIVTTNKTVNNGNKDDNMKK